MESVSGREISSIKICFSLAYFLAISFILASSPVQSFGELIVLRNPTKANDNERSLTCVSEDDDAALIWNYYFVSVGKNGIQDGFTNFEPKKPPSGPNSAKCAIWNSRRCLAEWVNNEGWISVNSAKKPMGPVLDYRWEGFKEFVLKQDTGEVRYQYVRQVNETTGTAIFSIRGLREVSMLLCEKKRQENGHCSKIVLGSWWNQESEIFTCPWKRPCERVANVSDGNGGVLDSYAWRTFTLKWNSGKKIVQIFKDTDPENEPFLQHKLNKWHNISHISVGGEFPARVRFHFYDYYRSEKENSVLSSKIFNHDGKNFCVELQVGLCPECKLRVDVAANSSDPRTFENIATIPGDAKSFYNGLLTWRSVKLNASVSSKKSSLHIKTILERSGSGQWAIHNFRMCKPVGSLRESSLTTHRENGSSLVWPIVFCQKLSNVKIDLVDSRSERTINGTSQLQRLVESWSTSCGSSCKKLGKNWSICNPTGCTCDRGFYGKDCNQECMRGHHGFNCTDECGSCKNELCNPITGHCSVGCTGNGLRPPLCKIATSLTVRITDIQNVTASSISDTEVTLQWNPSQSRSGRIVSYEVSIKIDKLIGCSGLRQSTTGQEPIIKIVGDTNVSVSDLHPYAIYTATVTPYTTIRGNPKKATFQTLLTNIPTSKVSNFRFSQDNERLVWDDPVDCTTITGPTQWKRLIFTGVSESVKNFKATKHARQYFELKNLVELIPYTKYRVRIHVIRNEQGTENSTCYGELEWRTPPAKPSSVKNLTIYEADPDTNTISLRWIEPQPANGEIESYFVEIEGSKTYQQNKTVKVLKREPICDQKGNYVCFRNLSLPPNVEGNNPKIVVYATNANVRESGIPSSVLFKPNLYFKVPSQPRNLAASTEGHGIVKLQWAHPSISYTKIVRFEIVVEVLGSKLSENITTRFPMMKDYVVSKKEKNYIKKLYLPTSTSYRISVMAINENNLTSSQVQVNTTLGDGVAFDGELNVTRNGTFINLIVPGVTNETRGTMVSVVVDGVLKCNKKPRSSLIVSTYKPKNRKPEQIMINTNDLHGNASSCSLDIEKKWEFKVIANDSDSGVLADLRLASMIVAEDKPQNLIWFIVSAIIIIAICSAIILFIWYRRFKRATNVWREPSYLDLSLPPFTTTRRRSSAVLCIANSLAPQPGTAEDRLSAHVYTIPNEPDSRSVSTEYFEEYAKEGSKSRLLYSQFMLLRPGLTRPCEYGRMPENMLKNRYRNLVAYDDSRVVLGKIPGEPYSDYINASYIKGYKKDKAYIATQGPKPNTVNDFWRMVWQEEVRIICMLTNLIEGNKTNCEKYWPDVGTRMKYGELHISTTDQQVFADYTFRTFKLSYQLDTRTVRHLHYTGWPSLGVPTYPQSLVAYLKKLEQTPAGNGPVVVHCHTGDGRTGTIILCDICLRRAAAEKVIDVTAVTTRMRDSRANMVGTLEQYVLAHIIIAESLASMPTQIPCTNSLVKGIKKMRMQLPTDIQRLNDTVWQGQTLQSLAVSRPPAMEDATSDQLPEHDPGTPEVIYDDVSASKSNWVSAVCVDGVKMKNQYLASCLPALFTLADFWIFVAERKIKLIIILQCSDPCDPTCCDIMPDESNILRVPDIQVENKTSLDDEDYFTTEKLLLTDTSEENTMTRSLTVLTCKGWGRGKHGKPPKPVTLVSLWRASEKIPRNEGETLVLCHDGISGCGLYLALSFLLERMAVERECDVISAVQTVRRSNPEFVKPLEQCEYLYDAAQTYAEYFECYANFT